MKYWGEDQESAIVEFNTNSDIEEKHKVFVAIIEPAFRKLVENIYYTYNFDKILWDREQIEHEVMTHLYEKLSKFDTSKNKKSFSYFGTITKNWMIQRCNADKNKRFIDDDNQDIIVQNISINAYEEDVVGRHNEEFIGEIIDNFDDEIGKQWKDEFLENFGYGLANVIDILDPDAIILGGGLSNIDFLYTEGKNSIYSKVFSDIVETPILKNKLGDSSGVFGAALLS